MSLTDRRFNKITQTHMGEYLGFLSTKEIQQVVRQCRALIITPRWFEAFANVAIEAVVGLFIIFLTEFTDKHLPGMN